MSSAMLSASGPTTTWTTVPALMTPMGAGGLEPRLVDEGGVLDLGAQAGDARLDLDDVVGAAEGGEDLLGLGAHGGSFRVAVRTSLVQSGSDHQRCGGAGLESLRLTAPTETVHPRWY